MSGFIEDLKRIHRAQGRPVGVKLPNSIKDDPRIACADCGDTDSTVKFTVEDILENERVVCPMCWRKAQGDVA